MPTTPLRLTEVKRNGVSIVCFVYDGDGARVKGTVNGVTTIYLGNHYEVSGGVQRKYYYAGGQRVAMRENTNAPLWLFNDHLGSTGYTVNGTTTTGGLRYKPFGSTRYSSGTTPTTYRYTGQREEASLGLYYYGARWYDPALGRFIQADTIVPNPTDTKSFDRYAYVYNNPLKYNDPTGHYGEDVHHDVTHLVVESVGTSINKFFGLNMDIGDLADGIAEADVGTDTEPATRPDRPSNLIPQNIQQYGEAVPENMSPTKYYHFMGQETAENRLTFAALNGDIGRFGQALHLYQDTFSHIESGYTLPMGEAGIADLQMCRGCDPNDPATRLRAGGFLGHVAPGPAALDPAELARAAHTDDFTGSPRDIRMVNGTGYWVAIYLLVNAGKSQADIDRYFKAQYGMSSQQYYQQNVVNEE
jgi:RHS repeat-associated protein